MDPIISRDEDNKIYRLQTGYAIFFEYNNKTYRLPVNPEQVSVSSVIAVETYEVLKLGQIAIPSHMQLKEYTFECELPKEVCSYSEVKNKFKGPDYYLEKFESWRAKKVPVQLIASNGITEDINTPVLIEELTVTEKAGEEGDKYVEFKLLEYRNYGTGKVTELKEVSTVKGSKTYKKKSKSSIKVNKKSTGYYIVRSGDSLWSIAKKYYGDGSKHNIIYNANKDKIKNPGMLIIGWKLKIPGEDELKKYSS